MLVHSLPEQPFVERALAAGSSIQRNFFFSCNVYCWDELIRCQLGQVLLQFLLTKWNHMMNFADRGFTPLPPQYIEPSEQHEGLKPAFKQFEKLTHHDVAVPTLQVNVVVMRGVNDDEIADFVELTRHRPVNVRLIEYMPFDGNVWSDTKMLPYRDMIHAVEACTSQNLQRLQVGFSKPVPFSQGILKWQCAHHQHRAKWPDNSYHFVLLRQTKQ